jgi:hypothetical protein
MFEIAMSSRINRIALNNLIIHIKKSQSPLIT